jgi:hypothetical protein
MIAVLNARMIIIEVLLWQKMAKELKTGRFSEKR